MTVHPALAEPSDAELVRRATAGEREAFAAIYDRHQGVVYRFARMMSGSRSVAEDVTQEVFVTLMRNLRRYEPGRSGLATYLYGVTRNLVRNRLRRERRFVEIAVVEEEATACREDPSTALIHSELLTELRRIIVQLPSRFREVVILCDLHALSYAEAAAALEIPVGTVRSRLSRGRRLVAARIRDAERPKESLSPERARCVV
jgi:RNA polymerase sigma-70 factor (ECF subfamily)